MALCSIVIVMAGCSTASGNRTAQGTASATAVRPTVSVARSCATSQPATWMGCIVSRDPGFAGIPLSEIAIPGAHDSGTFNLDASNFDTQSGSSCTSYTPLFTKVAALVKRWSEAQNIDFTSQLDDGVRYLDFRLAYTGNAEQGWRIVHTQFSNDPLRKDLSSIAAWAKAHPTEVVIVDVQHLCYDNSPSTAEDLDLWSDFSVLAPVIFDPGTRSVADSTLRDITREEGHNVVLMLPSYVLQPGVLLTVDHVPATFVTIPGASSTPGGPVPSVPEAYAWPSAVSPSSSSGYDIANHELESFPTTYSPPIGALRQKGLYQSQLIYSLNGSNLSADVSRFTRFSGLIPSSPAPGTVGGSATSPRPWEIGLWSAGFDRNDVLAEWGSRLNVVVSDGVEYGGYVPAVVEQNAAT
jgi:hypothetical protein